MVEFRPVLETELGAATAGIAASATPAGASENSSRNWTTNLTDGAFVSMDVHAPTVGRYALSIRYATPAAARRGAET